MDSHYNRSVYLITTLIIALGILISGVGVFFVTDGHPYTVVNQFGDTVRMYGNGLYAHDSYLYATIFRGTDFSILFIAIPLLITALILDMRRNTLSSRLFLSSAICIFTYYSASITFGTVYNRLHLAYILFFSASLFGLILSFVSLDTKQLMATKLAQLPYKGLYVFLTLCGLAVIVAWLPDIINSILSGRPPVSVEIYTTSVTNVLDIGVIGPAILLTILLIRKGSEIGYALVPMLLTLCAFVGTMVLCQTIFQVYSNVDLPLQVLVTQAASFVMLALFALYFDVRFFKTIKK